MFDNATLFALLRNSNDNTEVVRIPLDRATQKEINEIMAGAFNEFTRDKEQIPFDGNYKVEGNELLAINNFNLPDEVTKAIRNPLNVRDLDYKDDQIKAVFMGEYSKIKDKEVLQIAFQKFSRSQYVKSSGLNLYYSGNTFKKEKKDGLSILEYAQCIFDNGSFIFEKYKTTNEIMQLSEYYKEATQQEIDEFSRYKELSIPNNKAFIRNANDQWVRRKLKVLKESKVLQNNTAEEIKTKANDTLINIATHNGKVVFPEDKQELKVLLAFLVDEVFKGSFSNETYMTNSKKKIVS